MLKFSDLESSIENVPKWFRFFSMILSGFARL